MANEYAGLAEVKATLELSGESFADADIQRALTTASRGIDNLCGRRFYLDEDDTSVRYYTADSCGFVEIDDIVDVAEVATSAAGDGTFDDVWTENTDFVLYPLNATADGRPWDKLKVAAAGSYAFPIYQRSVRVTGQFGWNTVPPGVKEATIILASKIMRRTREAPFGVIAIGLEGGGVTHIARTDPDVMFLVGEYMRTPVAIA